MSFIPTTAFKGMRSDKGINYMKLRVGYGTSANFSTGYPTATGLSLNTQGWIDETEKHNKFFCRKSKYQT